MKYEQAHLHRGFFNHPLFYKYSWIILALAVAIALIVTALLINYGGGSNPYPGYYPY